MNFYKEVNWLFLFCAMLVAGGELHRVIDSKEFDVVKTEAEDDPSMTTTSPLPMLQSSLIFPVPDKSRAHLIGEFGEPRGENGNRKHEGIDISAKRGTPVVSVSKGKVLKVKEGGNGGKQVWILDSQKDWTYFYAHLHTQDVEVGQTVKPGDQIGTVGSTGNANENSPHLHFSIYLPNMVAIDPLTVLP